jgi:hypothetical protein
MYVVTYHRKFVGSYFIGVADSYENAERIIQEDLINSGETDCRLYHIAAVSLNVAHPIGIESAVATKPYIK